MPKRRKPGRPPMNGTKPAKVKQSRGRKHIFTPAQKVFLARTIKAALKEQIRALARAL